MTFSRDVKESFRRFSAMEKEYKISFENSGFSLSFSMGKNLI